MTIEPDTKDWTWVLRRPCPECGLDTQSFPREDVGRMTRANAAAWHRLLAGASASASVGTSPSPSPSTSTSTDDLRTRPAPGRWSALEYGCHVRDVLRLYDQRLTLMLTQDSPLYPNWNQDDTAVADRYGEQDPAVVDGELTAAAGTIAAQFDHLTPDQWQRTGNRSDGARFTVESFARYFVHDPVHHLYDVTGTRYADQ